MTIILDNYTPLTLSDCDVIIVPVQARNRGFMRHPLPDVKREFPSAYAYFRRLTEVQKIVRGKLALPRNESPKIVFLPTAHDYRTPQYLDWVEAGLIVLRERRVHDKYTIAFPALGIYEEDRIDVKKVFRLVKKYLGDGKKDVYFLTSY
jgi:hypothetical protein